MSTTGNTKEIQEESPVNVEMPEMPELTDEQEAEFIRKDKAQRANAYFRRLISSRKVMKGRKAGRKKR